MIYINAPADASAQQPAASAPLRPTQIVRPYLPMFLRPASQHNLKIHNATHDVEKVE
jgi:hypothetical protein